MFIMKFGFYLAVFGCFCVDITSQSTSCTTPNGESASCKPLYSCPILRNAIAITDPSTEKFVEASALACGNGTLNVCCGTFANYAKLDHESNRNSGMPTSLDSEREYALKHLLPTKTYCGMQHADDYFRDLSSTETTVDELPWVMFVSCEDEDGPRASSISSTRNFAITSRDCDCSGVLISNQYVLTAANCASAKWVGLGQREQYRNISCTATPFGDDCSEAIAKTPFTEQIRHPDNTLLLLRLKSKISYSDYVRPICLPLEESDRVDIGDGITTSQWKIDEKVRGFVRAKINHTITSNDMCSNNFKTLNLQNLSKYMCTSIENQEDTLCKTDSGGPMMYKRNNNWFVGGILHSDICTEKTAVGNRLSPEVVNWILENMKP